jgi:endonuclease-3
MKTAQIEAFFATLQAANPHPVTELEYTNVFELLAAVLLSAQATDVGVNKATRRLFPVANTPQKMLDLGLEGLEGHIRTIGLYHSKAKHLLQTCRILVEQHGGQVPRTREALEALPGVGRKTANVVLNVAFGEPTCAVDTHIFRVSNRTGLAPGKTPLEVEMKLLKRVPPRLPGGCAPLADPAGALRVPGAQATVLAVCRRRALRFQAEDAAASRRTMTLWRWGVAKEVDQRVFSRRRCRLS